MGTSRQQTRASTGEEVAICENQFGILPHDQLKALLVNYRPHVPAASVRFRLVVALGRAVC
eukprot:CAMPEP_0184376236 /NCGR_PEP_ID=MMETSP0007-20130409/1272_1 /TAXON_ID=97485 /ORGANISM="Prymnesium parvum, Strain Texoma1" /LENGTH=60 /DNA_ID=CAMNT_0026719703 /DNA_START=290 /DNA_END=472 /DNA_ORIENTATION=-